MFYYPSTLLHLQRAHLVTMLWSFDSFYNMVSNIFFSDSGDPYTLSLEGLPFPFCSGNSMICVPRGTQTPSSVEPCLFFLVNDLQRSSPQNLISWLTQYTLYILNNSERQLL